MCPPGCASVKHMNRSKQWSTAADSWSKYVSHVVAVNEPPAPGRPPFGPMPIKISLIKHVNNHGNSSWSLCSQLLMISNRNFQHAVVNYGLQAENTEMGREGGDDGNMIGGWYYTDLFTKLRKALTRKQGKGWHTFTCFTTTCLLIITACTVNNQRFK